MNDAHCSGSGGSAVAADLKRLQRKFKDFKTEVREEMSRCVYYFTASFQKGWTHRTLPICRKADARDVEFLRRHMKTQAAPAKNKKDRVTLAKEEVCLGGSRFCAAASVNMPCSQCRNFNPEPRLSRCTGRLHKLG